MHQNFRYFLTSIATTSVFHSWWLIEKHRLNRNKIDAMKILLVTKISNILVEIHNFKRSLVSYSPAKRWCIVLDLFLVEALAKDFDIELTNIDPAVWEPWKYEIVKYMFNRVSNTIYKYSFHKESYENLLWANFEAWSFANNTKTAEMHSNAGLTKNHQVKIEVQ